jgi:hypothetical protein
MGKLDAKNARGRKGDGIRNNGVKEVTDTVTVQKRHFHCT